MVVTGIMHHVLSYSTPYLYDNTWARAAPSPLLGAVKCPLGAQKVATEAESH